MRYINLTMLLRVVIASSMKSGEKQDSSMEFQELVLKAKEIETKYRQQGKQWDAAEYMQGFVGDVGDLAKLIMAKNGLRANENIDQKLAHELADCLWSTIIIADKLQIDLEKAFLSTMQELRARLDK